MASAQQPPTQNGNTGVREAVQTRRLARAEPSKGHSAPASIERLVNRAAAQITRLSAPEAFSASAADGVIIDIRSHDARELQGIVPGSLHIPRTVLEWRIAVDSPWRNIYLGGLDQRLILICDHGYSSILAAGNLVQLGFHRAGDIIGGFESWKDHGLPVASCSHRVSAVDALPGSGPPE